MNINHDKDYDFLTEKEFPWQYWQRNNVTNKTAIRLENNSIDWHELNILVDSYAKKILENNLQLDELIVIEGKFSLELLILHLAIWQIGAIVLVINPSLSEQQKQSIIQQTHPEFVIKLPQSDTHTNLNANQLIKYENIFTYLENIKNNLSITNLFPRSKQAEKKQKINNYNKLTNDSEVGTIFNPEQLASITLTSGSTGNPKAIAHKFSSHLYSAKGILEVLPFEQNDSWLLSLPLFHISGLAIVWRWLYRGACLHIVENNLLEDLNCVTHASLVPTQLYRYLNLGVGNHSLKHLLLGGAVIPIDLTNRAKVLNIEVWCGYGMTETASTVTLKKADEYNNIGKCLTYRKLKIINNQIFISGNVLASGYYVKKELIPLTTNDENYYATKDEGSIDNDILTVRGRVDSAFISGGEKVFPEEVEQILMTNSNIDLAVVIAIKDEQYGQIGVALIKDNSIQTDDLITYKNTESLKEWMKLQSAPHQRPKLYYYLPIIDNNSVKLSRYKLTKWFLAKI